MKRMVEGGYRKGPKTFMLMSDFEKEQWFDEEALRYLEEQLMRKQSAILELR